MKTKLILSLIAVFGLAFCVNAQEDAAAGPQGRGPGRRPDKRGPRRPMPPELLKKLDTDGDGKLSEEERKAGREAFMKKFDTDGDGKLSEEEKKAVLKARTEEYVKQYDKDGDGKLSVEELMVARQDRLSTMKDRMGDRRQGREGGDRRKKMMKKFDKDGDGKLSEEERKALHEQMKERRKQHQEDKPE